MLEDSKVVWKLNSGFENVLERIKELNISSETWSVMSSYYMAVEDDIKKLVNFEMLTRYLGQGVDAAGDPIVEKSYQKSLYQTQINSQEWIPVYSNLAIDDTEFYDRITKYPPAHLFTLMQITCQMGDYEYLFEFNMEKHLNTITVNCLPSESERALRPFHNFLDREIEQSDYAGTIFDS